MKLSKVYNPQEMNSYQFIAVTGLVMTFVAHLILALLSKTIDNFAALYLCWSVFFTVGTVINYTSKPDDHHHHH